MCVLPYEYRNFFGNVAPIDEVMRINGEQGRAVDEEHLPLWQGDLKTKLILEGRIHPQHDHADFSLFLDKQDFALARETLAAASKSRPWFARSKTWGKIAAFLDSFVSAVAVAAAGDDAPSAAQGTTASGPATHK